MALDAKDTATLDRVLDVLRAAFGGRLVAVALYGEAAGAGYRPRRSPLDVAVVLDVLAPADLRLVRPHVRAWQRRRISTPLLMDRAYIEESRDVFPLEFLELRDHHRMLHGPGELFESLDINREHLRLEVEEQLKGKLLHLREAYLALGRSTRGLRALLLQTPPAFEVILRGLLALRDVPRPDGPTELLDAVERAFAVALPTFHRLERVRAGSAPLPRGEVEDVFDAYLTEARMLARLPDAP